MFPTVVCTLAVIGSYWLLIRASYSRRPEVIAKEDTRQAVRSAELRHLELENALKLKQFSYKERIESQKIKIEGPTNRIKALETEIENGRLRLKSRLASLAREVGEERDLVHLPQIEAKARATRMRAEAHNMYSKQTDSINDAFRNSESSYFSQLAHAKTQAERDREQRLATKFDILVNSFLEKIAIGNHSVTGVSTWELNRAGFRTLADFVGHVGGGYLEHKNGTVHKLSGVGSARGAQLAGWRRQMIEKARRGIPHAEREAINRAIDLELQQKLANLAASREKLRIDTDRARLTSLSERDKKLHEAERMENDSKLLAESKFAQIAAKEKVSRANIESDEKFALEPLTRELWSLQSIVNPALHLIKTEQAKMNVECSELKREVAKAKAQWHQCTSDAKRYASISVWGLIKRAFT